MIKVYYGHDTFRSREAFQVARAAAARDARAPVTLLRDEQLTPATLQAAVEQPSLFGALGPLSVERLTAFTGSQAEHVARTLSVVPAQRAVFVWEDGVPAANGIVWRALRKAADALEEHAPLGDRELLAWMRHRVTAAGRSIDADASRALVDICGANLWLLAAELDKLALAGTGPIRVADVEELTPEAPRADLFATVRALARGDGRAALRLLIPYRQAGAEPRRLFFLLLRDLHALVAVRALLDHGGRPSVWDIAREFRLPKEAAAALLAAAKATTTPAAQGLFDRLVVAYYHLNTGRAAADELLEQIALARVAP